MAPYMVRATSNLTIHESSMKRSEIKRRPLADTVLARAQSRIANETAKRDRMRNGELGLDIYTMRPRLAEKGLRYFDSPEDVRD